MKRFLYPRKCSINLLNWWIILTAFLFGIDSDIIYICAVKITNNHTHHKLPVRDVQNKKIIGKILCALYIFYHYYVTQLSDDSRQSWHCRAESRFAPSQWEPTLQGNTVYHWLFAKLKSALYRADSRFALSQWGPSLKSNTVSHWLFAKQESALDSRFGPSQWERSLQSNTVSHWLFAKLVSALRPANESRRFKGTPSLIYCSQN